jgi:hypothetical protein
MLYMALTEYDIAEKLVLNKNHLLTKIDSFSRKKMFQIYFH